MGVEEAEAEVEGEAEAEAEAEEEEEEGLCEGVGVPLLEGEGVSVPLGVAESVVVGVAVCVDHHHQLSERDAPPSSSWRAPAGVQMAGSMLSSAAGARK